MGYMCHHAIIVTSWKHQLLEAAHAKAVELGARDPESYRGRLWQVTEITPEVTNGYRSFLVSPDGSKEGWGTSDAGDAARAEFVQWLDQQRYEDGSTSLAWVEISYGEENDAPPTVLADSSHWLRDFYATHPDGVEPEWMPAQTKPDPRGGAADEPTNTVRSR